MTPAFTTSRTSSTPRRPPTCVAASLNKRRSQSPSRLSKVLFRVQTNPLLNKQLLPNLLVSSFLIQQRRALPAVIKRLIPAQIVKRVSPPCRALRCHPHLPLQQWRSRWRWQSLLRSAADRQLQQRSAALLQGSARSRYGKGGPHIRHQRRCCPRFLSLCAAIRHAGLQISAF